MKTTELSPTINEASLKGAIIAEIERVYSGLKTEFYAWELTETVRASVGLQTGHRVYPDTVGRYFRQLRESKPGTVPKIKCECLNRQKSLYIKKP